MTLDLIVATPSPSTLTSHPIFSLFRLLLTCSFDLKPVSNTYSLPDNHAILYRSLVSYHLLMTGGNVRWDHRNQSQQAPQTGTGIHTVSYDVRIATLETEQKEHYR